MKKAKAGKLDKAVDWLVHELRAFQRQTLQKMGNSPGQIEEAMQKFASKKEETSSPRAQLCLLKS